jgi:hypothetical protein
MQSITACLLRGPTRSYSMWTTTCPKQDQLKSHTNFLWHANWEHILQYSCVTLKKHSIYSCARIAHQTGTWHPAFSLHTRTLVKKTPNTQGLWADWASCMGIICSTAVLCSSEKGYTANIFTHMLLLYVHVRDELTQILVYVPIHTETGASRG